MLVRIREKMSEQTERMRKENVKILDWQEYFKDSVVVPLWLVAWWGCPLTCAREKKYRYPRLIRL